MIRENWDALYTVTLIPSPDSDDGMLVATGATVMGSVDPWTTVDGRVTAVSICSTTF